MIQGRVDLAVLGRSLGFTRGAGVDGQRVDASLHQLSQGMIYEPMPCDAVQTRKAGADDSHGVVAAFAGAGVAARTGAAGGGTRAGAGRARRAGHHAVDAVAQP